MLTAEAIERILAAAPGATIGLLGDLFLDRYLDIDPALDEPSIETGLTAYQVTRVRSYPGALGTVLNNLAALGVGRLVPITIIGDDGEGYELRQELRAIPAVDFTGIIASSERRTPTYTKPMVLETARPARELNRLDIKNRQTMPHILQQQIVELLDLRWPDLDALLVLDQVSEEDCGVVTTRIREHLAGLVRGDAGKFVLADSRNRISQFERVAIKPNTAEFQHLGAGWRSRTVFQTDGESGIWLHLPGELAPINVPSFPVSSPIDVVGAGDSCSAAIACAMVAGVGLETAAEFGNLVASITIQQLGVTGTATPEQVRQRWSEVSSSPSR